MRIALLTITSLALAFALPGAGLAQKPAGVDLAATAQASEAAAKSSLGTLASLAKGENARNLGFAAPGDAEKTTLAPPLADFIIGLDALRGWQSGTDPATLLHSTGLIVYPVVAGSEVRSSVTLARKDEGWSAVAFGAPGMTVAVTKARDATVQKVRAETGDVFQVRIPAYNLVFAAALSGGQLTLTPAVDVPRFGLVAGAPVAAADLVARLKPEAERDTGLPR